MPLLAVGGNGLPQRAEDPAGVRSSEATLRSAFPPSPSRFIAFAWQLWT